MAPTGRISASIAMTTSTAGGCSEIIYIGRERKRVEDVF
jgi:hypothetical protein